MTALLEVKELVTIYQVKGGDIRAVDGVSFALETGEALGVVGESGCGKSSLGKTVIGLEQASAGTVALDGVELQGLSRAERRPYTRRLQIVFQDPSAALNPRKTVGDIVAEPLMVHGIGTRKSRRETVAGLLSRVGLPAEAAARFPHEFSGGQRQRISIARALALKPDVIVCDESVSALDLSVQAQILNLLMELQRETGVSLLFISHDLNVVQYMCSRIMVMYLGKVVETGATSDLWNAPLHPYTRLLLSSIPGEAAVDLDPQAEQAAASDMPSVLNVPSGCRFRTRCHLAREVCAQIEPELREVADGRRVACHAVFDKATWPRGGASVFTTSTSSLEATCP